MTIKDMYSQLGYLKTSSFIVFFLFLHSIDAQDLNDDGFKGNSTPQELVAKINRDIDPYFEYKYVDSKFVPPSGQTLLIMGQTLEDIDDYIDNFSNKPIPGGWSAYWGVPEFKGITSTFRNENGSSHNHQNLVDRFPKTAINSGLWMVGKWDVAINTAQGKYDNVIKKYAKWAKKVNRPIFLRIGYEFDGPHNELEPSVYVKAYKRIVDIIRKVGADNVAFVWHSYIFEPFEGNSLSEYFPGQEYVDWVGISLFGLLYERASLSPYGDAVLEFAKKHRKPVMVAEASPTSGINVKNLDVWNRWFTNFFTLCYQKNIKAISFINSNWEKYSFPGVDWKDARLSNNPIVSEAWFLETGRERYLKQSPNLFDSLGYNK